MYVYKMSALQMVNYCNKENVYYINPLVSNLDSHIKDTTDFLNKLSNLGNLTNNAVTGLIFPILKIYGKLMKAR